MTRKAVTEIVEKLPLDTIDQLDKLVVLCSDLGLEEQGRKVAEVCFFLSLPFTISRVTSY
jgi:hypothetical protein